MATYILNSWGKIIRKPEPMVDCDMCLTHGELLVTQVSNVNGEAFDLEDAVIAVPCPRCKGVGTVVQSEKEAG